MLVVISVECGCKTLILNEELFNYAYDYNKWFEFANLNYWIVPGTIEC